MIVAFLFPAVAFAQQPPQAPFAPYTITEKQHQDMLNYLGDVPAKYANPIINAFMQWEQQAQIADIRKKADEKNLAAEAKKAAEANKTPANLAKPSEQNKPYESKK
jgi:hypothetical protein